MVGGDTDIFDGGAQDSSVDSEPGSYSGTGFFVSSRGHLITNSHVVENCKSIRIKMPKLSWISADVVTQRKDLDLALLKASVGSVSNFAKIRSSSSVRIGDDAVIFGFPLVGALSSDGSVSTGTIASLSGIGGDTTVFQISVPVQPGNSGGPLVDRSGNVIGVVVAKLNAIEVAKVTGDVPQNVNFAIKSEVLIKFLDWIGSTFDEVSSGPSLSTADIAASLQQYSVLIECER
jgi:S1-C subfamily serine protease